MTPPGPAEVGYVVIRLPSDPAAGAALDHALGTLEALGWREAARSGRIAVWLGPDSRLAVRRWGDSGIAIGSVVSGGRSALPPPPFDIEPVQTTAERVVRQAWGRYLLVWSTPDGSLHVLRDPSGALDAVQWAAKGAVLVSGDPPEALDGWLPRDIAIDWPRLGNMVSHPALACDRLALTGLVPIPPGVVLSVGADDTVAQTAVWSPARAAGRIAARADQTPEALRAVVEAAVAGLTLGHDRLVGEISGGLDSAIVAATATPHLGDRAPVWLNYRADDPESDERRYARDLAALHGLDLRDRPKPVVALTAGQLTELGRALRPALQGLDPAYDADMAGFARRIGATGLLTGHGGDAVFFQNPTPLIVADRVARLGLSGLDPSFLLPMARWTRSSLWALLGVGLRQRLGLPPAPGLRADPYADRSERHVWLGGLEDLPLAKRGQIAQLVNCQLFFGDCLRARAVDLLHPLLSQPVVEHGLALPADVATAGGQDRALARRAFADRLPTSILQRQGKGEMSTFYGLTVRASLPLLGDWLEGGRLRAQGILTPEALSPLLDPDRLIWSGDYNVLLILSALESWARYWASRLARRPVASL
ncbi:asparagine synthase-related protein [Brevundimonas staleyi]|uniref:Asparagine synthase-related protein n=1 Tax=Brevundimonas staleyi TaxID=74326 RepID=A0ABW0FYX8_9CAUL